MPRAGTRVFDRLPIYTVEPGTLRAFGLAALLAAAALAVRLALGLIDPSVPPFAAVLVATMMSSILGGASAGFLCFLLGFAGSWVAFQHQIPAAFGPLGLLQFVLSSSLIIWISYEYRRLMRRIQDREELVKRQKILVEAENRTLGLIATDRPLQESLESIVKTIEQYSDVLASILLLSSDGQKLYVSAAPNLPKAYSKAIDGAEIGPKAGSCGTAAFEAKAVVVSDIETDPLWEDYRDLARQYNLRSCWAFPILSQNGAVLGTFAIYQRQSAAPSQQERDIVELLVKIAALAIERDHAREQKNLLMQEVTHRVKNLLSVVVSIASNTIRKDVDEATYTDFEKRLVALANAQSLLSNTNWEGVQVVELVKNIVVSPFNADDNRFVFMGPPVQLPAQIVLPFVLAIHELCTNAGKYGSLSNDRGTVEITWGYGPEGESGHFFLRWKERNGPPVCPPSTEGFGSRMIRSVFARGLGGDAECRYRPEGLECEIHIPSASLSMNQKG